LKQSRTIKNFRWWVVALIALATAINYLDRQNLPVALSEIRKSFPIGDADYGLINSLFLFAYGTMYAVGGRLIDVLGARKGYAIMIIWWSLANMLHGFVSGILGLGIARFLLGIGEGGAFPGSAKVVSEWFSSKDRSMAFGIFNTGSSLGAVVAPPMIALIIAGLNWRWTFFITGAIGLIWVVIWLRMYSSPAQSKYVSSEEKQLILSELEKEKIATAAAISIPWKNLFQFRKLWGLLIMKFLADAGWFFFIFWLPKYLNDIRGLDIKAIGAYAWIPYAFAGGGSFIGGWLSSYLLKKNLSLDFARKLPMGIAVAMLPASLLISDASLNMAIVFFSMAMFGHQLFSTIIQTMVVDMFPSKVVGSVSGLMGCAATFGAMLFSLVIGFVIQKFGYSPAFLVAGILHPLSFILLFIIIKKIEMVRISPSLILANTKA
jgi:ACS family hexuronate transporter-like MFS transporter